MFAQRRHGNVEDVEPVMKIRAKIALGDSSFRIVVGGRQHAHVNIQLGTRSQTAEFALFQHAQQLGLCGYRHLSQLIQQQRAP